MTSTATTNGLMTIGQVARAVGVPSSTLRYYERQGLLEPTGRSRAGYRFYDERALERLQFIRGAQAMGFTLDNVRTLLGVSSDRTGDRQASVQAVVERRMADVDQKLKDLRRVRAALGRALDRCRRSTGECAVLKELGLGKNRRRTT